MNIGKIKRGDIYSLKLDGTDPVLIIQSNIGRGQMLAVVPILYKNKKLYGNKKMRALPKNKEECDFCKAGKGFSFNIFSISHIA